MRSFWLPIPFSNSQFIVIAVPQGRRRSPRLRPGHDGGECDPSLRALAKQSRATRKSWIASSQVLLAMTLIVRDMIPHSRDTMRPSFARRSPNRRATVFEVDRCSAVLKAGARRAHYPRRLTALTPSAHRSDGFANARSQTERDQVLGSAPVVATGSVPRGNLISMVLRMTISLRTAGDERHFRLLSLGNQALIVGLEDGIVLRGCANAGHVDGVTNPTAATLDVTFATAFSAVVVIRGDTDQGRSDLVAHLTKLRHPCNQVCRTRLREPRHTLDDLGAFGKIRHGLDFGADGNLGLAISLARLFKTWACAF